MDRYEFTFASGKVIFDWGAGIVEVKANKGRRDYPPVEGEWGFEEVPLFTSFFVTGMSALYGIEVEVRGKMVNSREGFVLEIYRTREERDGKVAFLVATDTKKGASSAFLFNRANLYAFLQMIKERDKVVPVKDSVWEREEGRVYVNKLEIPYQKAKALEWILLEGLKAGKYPYLVQEWDEGRAVIRGRRLEIYRKKNSSETLFLSLSLKDPIDVMRILSCL